MSQSAPQSMKERGQWLLERRWVKLIMATAKGFGEDNCGQMAAALAYFALLSAFPLLLLVISQLPALLGLFGQSYDVQVNLLKQVEQQVSPQAAVWLGDGLASVRKNQGTAGLIGVLALLWSASGVFVQLYASFNRIWQVHTAPRRRGGLISFVVDQIRPRLVPFFLLLLVGVLLLASSLITAALAVVTALFPAELAGGLGSLVTWALSLAVSVLALALLYRFLPDALIRWGDVWVGALVAALANEVAKSLVTRFIASGTGGVYQTIAGPLALMVWVFFTSQILFAGCELTRHYALIYGSRAGADD